MYHLPEMWTRVGDMEKSQLLTHDGLKWNYFQTSGNSVVVYAFHTSLT